jgi:hypothetical protein
MLLTLAWFTNVIGSWQPTNVSNLKNVKFILAMGASAGQATGMTGSIDDVKIGK